MRDKGLGRDPPVLLVKWYDFTKWVLARVDSFPKHQRFIFGTRLADHVLDVMEILVEASYSRRKADLLALKTQVHRCTVDLIGQNRHGEFA